MNKVSEIFRSMEWGPAPEATDKAGAWLAAHAEGFGLFIGGRDYRLTDVHGNVVKALLA